MKNNILLIFFSLSFFSYGQTGFFGKKNSLEFNFSIAPSLARTITIKEKTEGLVWTDKNRYSNESFYLNYNRIINNKISIGIGVNFSNIELLTNEIRFEGGTLVTGKLKVPYYGTNFRLKYQIQGNISPIGKYIGFHIEYGRAHMNFDELYYYSFEEVLSRGRKTTVKIDEEFKFNQNNIDNSSQSAFIKFIFGRSFIINSNVFISCDGSFNIFRITTVDRNLYFQSIDEDVRGNYSSLNIKSSHYDNRNALVESINAYKRFTLNFGIHYAL